MEWVTIYRVTWRNGNTAYGTATHLAAQDGEIGDLSAAVKVEAATIPPDLWFDVSKEALPWT